MFAVNRLRKSLLSFYQKEGNKKSPRTEWWRARKDAYSKIMDPLRVAPRMTNPG